MKYLLNLYTITHKNEQLWVFDYPEYGLKWEALISGMDIILDMFANGRTELFVEVSDEPMTGANVVGQFCSAGQSDRVDLDDNLGFWYRWNVEGEHVMGWLCPNLLKFFDYAPITIWVKVR